MKIRNCVAVAAVVFLSGCMIGKVFNPDENLAVSPDGRNEIRLYPDPLAYEVLRDGIVVAAKTEGATSRSWKGTH